MKNTYKGLWIFLAVALGLFGAVLRGHELAFCYNMRTGLYTADYSSIAIIVLCVFAAVVFLIVGLTAPRDGRTFSEKFPLTRPRLAALVIAGFLTAVVGALYALSVMAGFSIYKLLLGILTCAAGVCILLIASRRRGEGENEAVRMPIVVTVFWVGFMMILTFMEHPVEPVLQLFAYDLLAMCSAALSVYCQAACAFGKNKDRIGLFSSLLAVTLLITSVGGRGVAALFTFDTSYFLPVLFRMGAMLALVFYCAQGAGAFLRLVPQSEEEEPEEPSGQDEE